MDRKSLTEYGRIVVGVIVIITIMAFVFGGIWFSQLRKGTDILPENKDEVLRSVDPPVITLSNLTGAVGQPINVKSQITARAANGDDITDNIVIKDSSGYYDAETGLFTATKPGRYVLTVSATDESNKYSVTSKERMTIVVDNDDLQLLNVYVNGVGSETVRPYPSRAAAGDVVNVIVSGRYGYNLTDMWVLVDDGTGETTIPLDPNTTQFEMPQYDAYIMTEWEQKNVVVFFDANGGDVSEDSKTVVYSEKYGELPTPTKTGYKFKGWELETGSSTELIDASSRVYIAEPHVLKAKWSLI